MRGAHWSPITKWHITGRLCPLTDTDATPRKTRALAQAQRDLMKQAKSKGRRKREWEGDCMLCCCRTSSQISPVHNTKQNKCPLLIKPHNKCRPFVFPFILSTARGGCRAGGGRGGDLAYLGQLGAQKKVALLLSSAHCSPSPHTPLSVVVLVSFTCAGDLPATHLHILKFIINNAATTEWNKRGRGKVGGCACGVDWVH